MLGQQFYNETMRKVVVAFGTMFNDISLVRTNNAGEVTQTMKVPLAYGPKQKWLARLREDPNLTKKVAVTLPRICLLYTSPSPRDRTRSRMPSSA